ncbi:cupin domain-containing protein [Phanerochaete sordida]|uniref:Cupin domain-containing protein n=1 Tax=Phanerochaete sordida TaxID=48140 RepID=A0A9P3G6C4_9APHY|nr:cupin domain-containing protein [Phanerochaete sordida]
MSTTGPPAPEPVRRIITGHDAAGKAVVADDEPVAGYPFAGSRTLFTDLWWQDGFPARNDDSVADGVARHDKVIINPNGSAFRVVDTPPHTKSSPHIFHRTISLDYGILISGTLTLVLDDGKRVVMKPGDVVVQRGTIHAWVNETDEWARMYFVLLPSHKVKVGDKELDVEAKHLPGVSE